ncbi:hypothetical protein BOX15_Mlig013222g4 [Macrostomum lignano]|uniref:Anaphase-promoting complex subunit 5 n=2 Tax=Macrostomum lignano TaxID=282301 RepID=A0A267DHU8_9PLAT|nr:hypothetical protein BOX15_Mlig013222g4 [Macrostomum lignano]
MFLSGGTASVAGGGVGGFGDHDPAATAAAAQLHSEDDLARAAETYQEYLTPHNVCMFVIIREYLQLCHTTSGCALDGSQLASVSMMSDGAGGADTIGLSAMGLQQKQQDSGLARTPLEKFELFNFILDQLDAEQLFPMETLMSRGRAVMKPTLCKQVDRRIRQFFMKQPAKETRSPFHMLETYLSSQALNSLYRDEVRGGGNGGPGLSPSSVCGAFMRKVVYAFQSRTFAQAYNFVGRLRMYYYGSVDANDTFPGPDDLRRRQNEEVELHTHGLLDTNRFLPEDEPDAWQLDRRRAEALVAEQAFLLEHNPSEAADPNELEERLSRLCSLHPGLDSLLFLRYLNSVRQRDRTGAERHLRAYFDLRGERGDGGLGNAYDVMALASMMHYFGFRDEAQMPLKEALLHCLARGEAGPDRARSPAELALSQMRSDARRLLSCPVPLRGVLARILLDKAGAAGKPKLIVASTVQQVLSACHLFGLHSVSSVLAQVLLLTDLSERGIPLLNESVAVAAAQLAVQLGEQGASDLASDLLDSLQRNLRELRSPLTQALDTARRELQFQRALFSSDHARAASLAAAADVQQLGDGGDACIAADSLLKRAVAQLGLANLHTAHSLCGQALALLSSDKGTPAAALAVRARLLLCEAALIGRCPSLIYSELAQCRQLIGDRLFNLDPLIRLYQAAALHASGRPADALAELAPGRCYLMSQASLCLRARLLLLEAQALSALDRLRAAVRRLLAARRGFRAIGCVGRQRLCCLLLAHLYHRLGLASLRNRAASEFGRLPAVPDPVSVL